MYYHFYGKVIGDAMRSLFRGLDKNGACPVFLMRTFVGRITKEVKPPVPFSQWLSVLGVDEIDGEWVTAAQSTSSGGGGD
jgi:hypothetical protein